MPLFKHIQAKAVSVMSHFEAHGLDATLQPDLNLSGDIDLGWVEDWLQLDGKFTLHIKGSVQVHIRQHKPAKTARAAPKKAATKKKATKRRR